MSAKPPVQLGKLLDFPIPPFLAFAGSSDEGLSRFCRLHGWPIWVKGPEYDAVPVWSWYEMAPVVQRLSRAWGGRDRLFLQAHVEGQDVTMAFAAWEGKLLGAAFLEKLDRTYEGKAWSGRVSRLPGDLEHALRKFVRATRWSGGGEIECVRDPQLRLWLLECNPRFPAWIYGATQAGLNLPAMLVQAVTRRRAVASRKTRSETFTRVVLEVPAGA
jgi:predicted ATP-grasp superfamily ATP-dependent carboligase